MKPSWAGLRQRGAPFRPGDLVFYGYPNHDVYAVLGPDRSRPAEESYTTYTVPGEAGRLGLDSIPAALLTFGTRIYPGGKETG
jgi:hypothetical protein